MNYGSLRLPFAALGVAALASTGCQTVAFGDSIDVEFDFDFLIDDELHTPYVAGSEFRVYLVGPDDNEVRGWQIESSDADILQLGSTVDGWAEAQALDAGTLDLVARNDSGDEVHRSEVEVMRADRIELRAHGPIIVNRPELQPAQTDRISILVGGTGTFLVHYYRGDVRLHGNGALSARGPQGVTVEARQSFLFEDREWVSFTADEPGEHDVSLLVDGEPVRTVTIVAVEVDDVADIRLHGEDESEAEDGDLLAVFAQGYDSAEEPIYGIEFEWEIDGLEEPGEGDLFRYEFLGDLTRELCARWGEMEVIVEIDALRGYVDSTNDIGCSVGRVGAIRVSLLWVGFGLVVGLLLGIRRRRRSA